MKYKFKLGAHVLLNDEACKKFPQYMWKMGIIEKIVYISPLGNFSGGLGYMIRWTGVELPRFFWHYNLFTL